MESEEHLNLRWNDHTLTFVHLLDHYRVQEQYCDARLACAGGGVYPVHKVVLSACSDFFASIFASDSCHNPVVVLQDVATEHLEALLTYVYRGEVLLARSDLPAFLKVAESLQVKGLAPPPLIPLPRDAWDSSVGVSDNGKHLSVHSHPPHHYKHLDSSQYPRSDAPSSSPVGCDGVWDGEGVRGSAAPLHTHHMARGSGKENGESVRPPRKRFSPHFGCTEQFGGTFRNLVASEEGDIKKEPQEEEEDENTDYLDTDSLTICEEEGEEAEMDDEVMKEEHDELTKERENEQRGGERVAEEAKHEGEQRTQQEVMEKEEEDDKEGRKDEGRHEDRREAEEKQQIEVKIMLDTRQHPEIMNVSSVTTTPSPSLSIHSPTPSNLSYSSLSPSPSLSTLSPTPAHHARSPTQPHSLSPTPAHTPHSPMPATPPSIASQLRQELLKPLHYRVSPSPHHPISHSVIASRDGEAGAGEVSEMPREPPPLVKISAVSPVSTHQSLLPYQYHHRPHHHHHHHHQHQHHHHHPHLHSRQSDGQEDNTPITPIPTATISSPPPFTTTTTNKTHHLLVTTQPTYRARLPPPPPSTAVPLSPYHSTPCQYKNLQVLDTDAPLNLSQDTQQGQNRTQQAHSTHRHRASHQERQREGDPFLGKILTNRKRRLRGPKSWEYLVRLLRDPSTNPSLIRWENEAKGVFRLVQPAAIAQRWGRRTGKHASECLTYENFARGLRYHYATGALEPVSERSFVYKFGPKAHLVLGDGDWRVLTGETTVTSAGAVATRT
ncbi:hypothetical protein O3P69_016004 [Scylla paramamosain]|uniref:Uncharacterized protein n=1 Tax=Scylla paramamosain TaxID=85552 RepID=A0AAW0T8M9_SCYPA